MVPLLVQLVHAVYFPLDLAKTRLQDQRTVSRAGGKAASHLYKNVYGLGINLVLVNPEKAIKLAVNDQLRQYFGAKKGSFLPLHYETLAGGLAGLCQVVVTTPMEFLKIQMQIAGRNAATGQSASRVAMDLFKEKGVAGVYRGLGATIIRDVPFSCLYFPLFAYLNSKGYQADGSKPHAAHSLACGLLAGMFSAGTVTPLDVIKTRLQVLKRMEGEPVYNGFSDAAVQIYRNEGVSAFFKGAVPRMIVVAPLFGIAQMVYFFGIAEKLFDSFGGKENVKKYD